MKDVFLAIDIGTTNIKCVAADLQMKMLAAAEMEYHTQSCGIARFEQRCEDWWEKLCAAIREVLANPATAQAKVRGIAVSSQAPTMLAVDKNGSALYPALIWMDRRSDAQCQEIDAALGADEIFRITGNATDPFYTFSELLWFKENEKEKFDKTACVLQANGYINYRLTGEMTIDRVHASITQCYDVKRETWDEDILSRFDIPKEILPRVVECDEIIGCVSEQAARETGLPKGIPVLGGSVDGAAAGLEGGVSANGIAVEMSGTSSVLLVGSEQMHTCRNLTYMYSAIHDQHLLLGCMSTTGGALKWYRDHVYAKQGEHVYEEMNREILRDCPEPANVIFLPYLAGERAPIWDTHVKGAFLGITPETQQGELLRAIQEGACFALQDNMLEAKRAGAEIHTLRAVGGTTHSDIWMKIKASIVGMPIEIPESNLGAPGGLLALLASRLGDYATTAEACKANIRIARTVDPENRWIEPYCEQFELFKEYYRNTKSTFRKADELRQKRT